MTKHKILLQYNGCRFAGWQAQKNQKTVQGTVTDALRTLTAENVTVVGAGRTDAGVHALGQVAHFRLKEKRDSQSLHRALNGLLPWDIRILRVSTVGKDFHAQKDALKKRYEYRIYNGHVLSPFLKGYVYHVFNPLDCDVMQRACELLRGHHDFSGFAATSTTVKNRHRKLLLSSLKKRGGLILYRIEADGFLHHMIRNIVGTLLQIGAGKRSPKDVASILLSRDRRNAGPTAPAHGLFLVRIWY